MPSFMLEQNWGINSLLQDKSQKRKAKLIMIFRKRKVEVNDKEIKYLCMKDIEMSRNMNYFYFLRRSKKVKMKKQILNINQSVSLLQDVTIKGS